VHISGKDLAVINVLYYRDASLSNSEMSAQQLVFKSERIASLGFNEISPFREYKEKFSHYAELEQGACKKDEKILGFLKNIFKQLPPDRAGEALPGSKTAYINFNTAKDFTTAIHETGHSFCRLDDEYIVDSSSIPSENTNCRKSNFWPAEFGNQIKGCTNNDFFRSTENSIMNKDYLSQEFNIVSCGYCLREINFRQKPIEDYWKSCLSLGVVKPKIQSQHEELAEEKCFIQLNINEKKLNNNIQFALASQENVYGAYIIMPYVDDDYKIIAYDNSKNILSSQGLDSSRFVYWDGDSGGVNEFNEANLQIVIPYNPNLAYVSIKTSESEQFIEFNPNLIECKKDCKIAGESGIFSQDSCCLGVNAVPKNSSNFICTKSEDINQDGRINILDLLFVRNHLNQAVITGADIRADVNNDNKIDILDLINIRNAIS